MRVENFLRESAWRYGEKIALVTAEKRLTYNDLDILSDRLCAALVAFGVNRGDRVVIFMDNCWEAVVSIFGILKAGAIFSPINPSTKAEKLAVILTHCKARAIITNARLEAVSTSAVANAPSVETVLVAGASSKEQGTAHSFEACIADTAAETLVRDAVDTDLAMLIYTSGTTGQPKGVMLNHRNVEATASSIITYLKNTSDDIILNVLPIAFGYGLYQLITSVKTGATLILEKSFAFPTAVFDIMRKERVTGFPLVPTMAAMIIQMKDLKPESLPRLRYITSAAAPLPPPHLMRLRELFPDTLLYSMYGQTECQRCTWLPPDELDRRPGSIGIAIPNTEVFIVDDNNLPVPPGVVGELVVRGPHVMQGYWEDKVNTDRVLRPGSNPEEKLLYTGDLCWSDSDGFLYFFSRKDDIIKTRGEKVAPKEVEAVLHACPGVVEAVVLGVPDPLLGQALQAIVVADNADLTEGQIIRYCSKHLEDFMVPKSIVFRADIPKTDSGKI